MIKAYNNYRKIKKIKNLNKRNFYLNDSENEEELIQNY